MDEQLRARLDHVPYSNAALLLETAVTRGLHFDQPLEKNRGLRHRPGVTQRDAVAI
jgi:hypothetical protein